MNKTKIFGTIFALTLAIIPTADIALSNKITTPTTASAATYDQAGVYQTTKATQNVYLNDYCMYHYNSVSYAHDINLVKGAYVYSDGKTEWGPSLSNSKYDIPYLRISVGGRGYWVPKDNLKFYR